MQKITIIEHEILQYITSSIAALGGEDVRGCGGRYGCNSYFFNKADRSCYWIKRLIIAVFVYSKLKEKFIKSMKIEFYLYPQQSQR